MSSEQKGELLSFGTEPEEGGSLYPLRPYHVFSHKGGQYLINVDAMTATALDETTAAALTDYDENSTEPLPVETLATLKRLDLLDKRPENEKPKRTMKAEPVSNIALFVTQTCNLRCVYCYGDGGTYGSGGTMEEPTALRAVDWLVEQSGDRKKLDICFFGGEPLMNFPLIQSVVYHSLACGKETDKTFTFSMTTNGTLLDDANLAFIKEHRISVLISMDGPQHIQDAQRPGVDGKGSYELIVPKVKKLLEFAPDTPCRATLVGDTDAVEVRDALRRLGFRQVFVTPASSSLFGNSSMCGLSQCSAKGLSRMMERETESWLKLLDCRDVDVLKARGDDTNLIERLAMFLNKNKRRYPCGAGIGMAGVSVDGDIFLCHRFVGTEEFRLGSVFKDGLDRDRYLGSPTELVEECSRCFAKYMCAGGCKHENFGATGDVFAPSPSFCETMRRQMEMTAYLASHLDDELREFLFQNEIVPQRLCPFDWLQK